MSYSGADGGPPGSFTHSVADAGAVTVMGELSVRIHEGGGGWRMWVGLSLSVRSSDTRQPTHPLAVLEQGT